MLSVMVFISFAVSAGTGTDPSLERSPSQDLAAGRREKSVTLFLLGKCITARCSAETGPAECLPRPSVCMDCSGSDRAPKVRSARTPSAAVSWGKRSSWGGGKAPAAGGKADAGLDPRSLRAGFFPSWPTKPRAGAGGGGCHVPFPQEELPAREDSFPRVPSHPAAGSNPRPCSNSHSLSRLQGDDDEDGPPVHSSHAAAVAHEVVQDGGELGPHLPGRGEQALRGNHGRGEGRLGPPRRSEEEGRQARLAPWQGEQGSTREGWRGDDPSREEGSARGLRGALGFPQGRTRRDLPLHPASQERDALGCFTGLGCSRHWCGERAGGGIRCARASRMLLPFVSYEATLSAPVGSPSAPA